MKYVCLFNPHDGEWKLFKYEEGKRLYAPNYGCPIFTGKTIDECIDGAAEMFGIDPEAVVV